MSHLLFLHVLLHFLLLSVHGPMKAKAKAKAPFKAKAPMKAKAKAMKTAMKAPMKAKAKAMKTAMKAPRKAKVAAKTTARTLATGPTIRNGLLTGQFVLALRNDFLRTYALYDLRGCDLNVHCPVSVGQRIATPSATAPDRWSRPQYLLRIALSNDMGSSEHGVIRSGKFTRWVSASEFKSITAGK